MVNLNHKNGKLNNKNGKPDSQEW